MIPESNIVVAIDLLRSSAVSYRAFVVTPDIDLYLKTHDILINDFFDVLILCHKDILATKVHIKINRMSLHRM